MLREHLAGLAQRWLRSVVVLKQRIFYIFVLEEHAIEANEFA
jgi:hypothetical protein